MTSSSCVGTLHCWNVWCRRTWATWSRLSPGRRVRARCLVAPIGVNKIIIILRSPFCVLVTVVSQSYQVHVHDEYVLLGNAGLLRCLIPSFVSDFVIVDTWVGDDGTHITADSHGIDSQATTNHTRTVFKNKISMPNSWQRSLDPSGNAGMEGNGPPTR